MTDEVCYEYITIFNSLSNTIFLFSAKFSFLCLIYYVILSSIPRQLQLKVLINYKLYKITYENFMNMEVQCDHLYIIELHTHKCNMIKQIISTNFINIFKCLCVPSLNFQQTPFIYEINIEELILNM